MAIGVPLIGLAYGEAGMVTLFTIISLHALILLTLATIALELAVAREAAVNATAPNARAAWHKPVLDALRNGILHPVPLPILVGLLFAQTGLVMPTVLDRPLQLLGNAMGPMSLLLVGATLASARIGGQAQGRTGPCTAEKPGAASPGSGHWPGNGSARPAPDRAGGHCVIAHRCQCLHVPRNATR